MSDRIDTDAVLHNAMLANHLEKPDDQVDLEGDLYRPKKEKQRAERDFIYEGTKTAGSYAIEHIAFEGVAEKIAHWAGHEACLPFALATETIGKAFKTIHEGDELNLAVKREYGVAACLALCVDALPAGFRGEVSEGFVGKGKASPGAALVLTTIVTRPDADHVQEGIVANCRDGQARALERRITTADDLATALKQNREFKLRYEHDLAFKLGVDSVIWAQAHGKLPEIEGQIPPPPTPATLEVRA